MERRGARERDLYQGLSQPGEIYASSRCKPRSIPRSAVAVLRGSCREVRTLPFAISGIISGSKPEIVTVLPRDGSFGRGVLVGSHLLGGARGRGSARGWIARRRVRQNRRRFRGCDAPQSRIAIAEGRVVPRDGDGDEHPPSFSLSLSLGRDPAPREGRNGAANGTAPSCSFASAFDHERSRRGARKRNIKRALRCVPRRGNAPSPPPPASPAGKSDLILPEKSASEKVPLSPLRPFVARVLARVRSRAEGKGMRRV